MSPEEIKEIQRQSFERLGKGLDHGVQWKESRDAEWVNCSTRPDGTPYTLWDSYAYRIRPDEPAHATIRIGALELPKPEKHIFGCSFKYDLNDYAAKWTDLFYKLQVGDHETIAAITQQAKVEWLEEKLEEAKIWYNSLCDTHTAKCEELRELDKKVRQQREIDREALARFLCEMNGVGWEFYAEPYLELADEVIKHLNAKPVDPQGPQELKMPKGANHFGDQFISYQNGYQDGVRDAFNINAEAFARAGLALPKELTK